MRSSPDEGLHWDDHALCLCLAALCCSAVLFVAASVLLLANNS